MKDYIGDVLKTESNDYEKIKHRIATRKMVRLLHGAIGLQTEAGELLDGLKKTIFYGKPLDEVNMKEEVGDCLWYIALILHELKSTFDEVQEMNIQKLFARYGISFNEEGALNRDLSVERYVLEKKDLDINSTEDAALVGFRNPEVVNQLSAFVEAYKCPHCNSTKTPLCESKCRNCGKEIV